MFNKTPYHWAFYIKKGNNYVLISDRVCTRPTMTKDYKVISKLLQNNDATAAGCMLYVNFKDNTV